MQRIQHPHSCDNSDGFLVKCTLCGCRTPELCTREEAVWLWNSRTKNKTKERKETCRERLAREHPEKVNKMFDGGCFGCPTHYGYADKPEMCEHSINADVCSHCWDRPVEEEL